MKKICLALTAALVISTFASMTAFAAPAGATTQANGDKTMSFTLGGSSSSGGQASTPAAPKPTTPANNSSSTTPASEQYLTHDEIIQLGKDMAAEYGLEWHDGPKKTFEMSVLASGTRENFVNFYNNCFTTYVEAGYESIYIVIFHDGNDYALRIFR